MKDSSEWPKEHQETTDATASSLPSPLLAAEGAAQRHQLDSDEYVTDGVDLDSAELGDSSKSSEETEDVDGRAVEQLRPILSFTLYHKENDAEVDKEEGSELAYEGPLHAKVGKKWLLYWMRLGKSGMLYAHKERYTANAERRWSCKGKKPRVEDMESYLFLLWKEGEEPDRRDHGENGRTGQAAHESVALRAPDGPTMMVWITEILCVIQGKVTASALADCLRLLEEDIKGLSIGQLELEETEEENESVEEEPLLPYPELPTRESQLPPLALGSSSILAYGDSFCLQGCGRWVSTSARQRFSFSLSSGRKLVLTHAQVNREVLTITYPYEECRHSTMVMYGDPFRLRLASGHFLVHNGDGFVSASKEDPPSLFRLVKASIQLDDHRESTSVRYNDAVWIEVHHQGDKGSDSGAGHWGAFWGIKGRSRKMYDSNLYISTATANTPGTFLLRHVFRPLAPPPVLHPLQCIFSIVNYNVWMLPDKISRFSGTSPLKTKRAEWIPPALSHRFPIADVVVFEEAFCRRSRPTLLRRMKQQGFLYETPVVGHLEGNPRKILDGGVVIVSKWPIEYADTRLYGSVCALEDRVADKGIIYARIRKENRLFHVFGTHMQAWNKPEALKTRRLQVSILRSFIEEKQIPRTEPVFIVGDLNVDRLLRTESTEYSEVLEALGASDPDFVEGEGDLRRKVSFDPENNPLCRGTVSSAGVQEDLDYILYSTSHLLPKRSQCSYAPIFGPEDFVFNGMDCRDLSDHYPLAAVFEFDFPSKERDEASLSPDALRPDALCDVVKQRGERGSFKFELTGLELRVVKMRSKAEAEAISAASSPVPPLLRLEHPASLSMPATMTVQVTDTISPLPRGLKQGSSSRVDSARIGEDVSTSSRPDSRAPVDGTVPREEEGTSSSSPQSSGRISPHALWSSSETVLSLREEKYAVLAIRDHVSSSGNENLFDILLTNFSAFKGRRRNSSSPSTLSKSSHQFRVYLETAEDKEKCMACIQKAGQLRIADATDALPLHAFDIDIEDIPLLMRDLSSTGFHLSSSEERARWLLAFSSTWYKQSELQSSLIRLVVEARTLEMKVKWIETVRKNLAVWGGNELTEQFVHRLNR